MSDGPFIHVYFAPELVSAGRPERAYGLVVRSEWGKLNLLVCEEDHYNAMALVRSDSLDTAEVVDVLTERRWVVRSTDCSRRGCRCALWAVEADA